MINWSISHSGPDSMKVRACLLDILLLQACFNDHDYFEECMELIEYGKDSGTWHSNMTSKILDGIRQMNWEGYFD